MIYQREKDTVSAYLDGDICIFDSKKYQYLNLNQTASFIWDLIEEPKTLSEIMNELDKFYDIEYKTCLIEVNNFLNEAIKKSLINVKK